MSGKPVSHWLENLSDLSIITRSEAVDQIVFANDQELYENAKKDLIKIAVQDQNYNAAMTIYSKDREVFPECAELYAKFLTVSEDGQAALIDLAKVDAPSAIEGVKAARNNIEKPSDGRDESYYREQVEFHDSFIKKLTK